jgi:hypothetical protein
MHKQAVLWNEAAWLFSPSDSESDLVIVGFLIRALGEPNRFPRYTLPGNQVTPSRYSQFAG